MADRPNLTDCDLEFDAGDPDGYRAGLFRPGPGLGAKETGMSVYELPPGQSICPYHYEFAEEEWLLVLSGTPTVRTPEGERELQPWDVVCFPTGEAGAHKVTNRTDETLRVGMLSTKPPISACVYPDLQKMGAWPPGKLFRLADAVDYWDGES
jgi:uncharacterized cupin superfamily protein